MANITKSIGVRICLFISFLSIIYTLYAGLNPIYTLNFTERFTLAAAFTLSLGIATILIAHQMQTDEKKQRIYHIFWWILFLYYIAQMIYMLFFASEFSRQNNPLFDGHYLESLKQQWELRTNLKPFDTIHLMMNAYANDLHDIATINLLGNFVAFMPFAFFLPKLFSSMTKCRKFLGFMCLLILSVEIIQLLTLSGTMDIDDFLLNMSGTTLSYFILKIPFYHLFTEHPTSPSFIDAVYVKKEIEI